MKGRNAEYIEVFEVRCFYKKAYINKSTRILLGRIEILVSDVDEILPTLSI